MSPEDKAKAGLVGVRRRRGRVNGLSKAAGAELPAMPSNLRPEVDAAREVHKTRPTSPGVRVYADGAEGWMLDAPHRDLEAWEVQICEAFGTRSHSVMWTLLSQIANLTEQTWRPDSRGEGGRWVPNELELNFILATIHSERPDTPLQAAVVAQIITNHLLQMRLNERTLGSFVDPHRAGLTAKLQNAFANQLDAYQRLRGRIPKQEVTVRYERHVHVHHHKHAHIHTTPPVEGGGVSDDQSLAHVAALPGPDAAGNVVPIPSRPREGEVQDARRTKPRRA